MPQKSPPTVVITGSNRGIGLSFAKHYSQQGATVYALCRRPSVTLSTLNVHIIPDIDMASDTCASTICSALTGTRINLLINNAGILNSDNLGQIDPNSIREQFEINALGPLKLTEALIPLLSPQAKIAMITSRMGSITDNTSGGRYGYRMSKAALNIASVSLAHDLKKMGIAIAILHPGLVGTDMIGGTGNLTPDQAAKHLALRIEELTLDNSGSFRHSNGEPLPW